MNVGVLSKIEFWLLSIPSLIVTIGAVARYGTWRVVWAIPVALILASGGGVLNADAFGIRRFGKDRCVYAPRNTADDAIGLCQGLHPGEGTGLIEKGTGMHPLFEKADALTSEVIEAAIEVQKHFGIGLLENIYKQCLAQEMRVRGHTAETEVEVPITYKGLTFDQKLRLDCLVDKCLIVECKSLDEDKVDMVRHKSQLLSYMKLMNIPLGLVINFGDYRLGKRGIARVILKGADEECPF